MSETSTRTLVSALVLLLSACATEPAQQPKRCKAYACVPVESIPGTCVVIERCEDGPP